MVLTEIRKKAAKLFALAILCAFIAFYAFFVGGWNLQIALGVTLLGVVGFVFLYSKAYDLWHATGESATGKEPEGDRS